MTRLSLRQEEEATNSYILNVPKGKQSVVASSKGAKRTKPITIKERIIDRSDVDEMACDLPRGGKRSIVFISNETLDCLLADIEVGIEYIPSEPTQGYLNITALSTNSAIHERIADRYVLKSAPKHLKVQPCPE